MAYIQPTTGVAGPVAGVQPQRVEVSPETFSYPLRTSLILLLIQLSSLQLILGSASLLTRYPLIAIADVINPVMSAGFLYSVLTIGFQLINLIFVIWMVLTWAQTTFIIRPKEIVIHRGIWRITENAYSTERIEEVDVDQSLWGRLFNYGTLRVYNPMLKVDLVLPNIPDPNTYAQVIKRSQSKEIVRFYPKRTGE
ncbi:PH domain-containing protein [Candidatus Berkelbacteria bacterium]|nr:PH domain-containing protein [Candidatus Berkelbacteria bacterium]